MDKIRNFCIIAHIDHGKSTLADRMMEKTFTVAAREMRPQLLDQMDLEREKGITIKLQPVRMQWQANPKSEIRNPKQIQNSNFQNPKQIVSNFDIRDSNLSNSGFILNLIDTPGHVDFSYEVSRSLAAVEGAILLVDVTQGVQAQTLANLHLAEINNLTIIPVINKIDLAGANIEETEREIKTLLGDEINILRVSAKTGAGVEELLDEIVAKVPPPSSHNALPITHHPLRALVFDSIWDRHRGVIAYIRIVDGEIKKGDKIQFLATGASDEALEVGTFSPKLIPAEKLSAGEIGYIVTGLKNVSEAKVGDTIFNLQLARSNEQQIKPLEGYHDPQPMVFASFYTTGGEADELREALAKLKLNDASLTFETERSLALGAGFRCGFLGMLHLEIVKERLEREYNLDLIVTAPQVNYREIGNSKLASSNNYEEPWVKLEIITPEEYLGGVMQELANRRANYKNTDYLGDRVELVYEAPLGEIIIDFYDRLKSISSGYASMNYELIDYRAADLEQLEILIAEEKVEAFSQLMDKSKIERRARELVKKLKDLLPRQMFEVKIQAVAGSRIIASERISALRKDVTAKLYGGDVTRKNKLLKKQAKGKKRMMHSGRVEIPSEVFVKMLR